MQMVITVKLAREVIREFIFTFLRVPTKRHCIGSHQRCTANNVKLNKPESFIHLSAKFCYIEVARRRQVMELHVL